MVAKNANYGLFAAAISKVSPPILRYIAPPVQRRARRFPRSHICSRDRSPIGFPGNSTRFGKRDARRDRSLAPAASPDLPRYHPERGHDTAASRHRSRSRRTRRRAGHPYPRTSVRTSTQLVFRTVCSWRIETDTPSPPARSTQTNCEGLLTGAGPITVFCPNDDAFVELAQKLGTTKMDLMSHQALPNIVKHHVIQGAVTLADMSEGKTFTTAGGSTITCSGGKVNGMSFKKNDIKVGNGIVHAVNGVIPSQ